MRGTFIFQVNFFFLDNTPGVRVTRGVPAPQRALFCHQRHFFLSDANHEMDVVHPPGTPGHTKVHCHERLLHFKSTFFFFEHSFFAKPTLR